MRNTLLSVVALFLFSTGASAQTSSADSRTLQAILEEVHKLRKDLQTTSATVQRAEILLYRVRVQLDMVERVSQRLEQAHDQVSAAKEEQNHFLVAKKHIEDQPDQDPAARKELQGELAAMEIGFEQIKDKLPEAEAREAALRNELQTEQSKLDDLLEQLDRLDKKLEADLQPRPQ